MKNYAIYTRVWYSDTAEVDVAEVLRYPRDHQLHHQRCARVFEGKDSDAEYENTTPRVLSDTTTGEGLYRLRVIQSLETINPELENYERETQE